MYIRRSQSLGGIGQVKEARVPSISGILRTAGTSIDKILETTSVETLSPTQLTVAIEAAGKIAGFLNALERSVCRSLIPAIA